MDKSNQLLGLANNLVSNFIGVNNIRFLKYIESFPVEKTNLFEIDTLKETITPEDLINKNVKDTIAQYKKGFLLELDKFKIEIKEIEKVIVKIAYKQGKPFGKYSTCNATITSEGKEYTKKVFSSYP